MKQRLSFAMMMIMVVASAGLNSEVAFGQSCGRHDREPQNLDRAALAHCLHVDESVFERYSDFESLVLRNGLRRDFFYHQHQVVVEPDGTLVVLYDGTLTPWVDVKDKLAVDEQGLLSNHTYTHRGFTPGSRNESLPVFEVDQRHGNRYVIEIITNWTQQSWWGRPSHAWMRLVDNQGNVKSVGFYGECLLGGLGSFLDLMTPHPGIIYSPDLCEVFYLPYETLTVPIELTEAQYVDVLNHIAYLQEEHAYAYQLMGLNGGANCSGFLNYILSYLGFDVPGVRLLMPSHVGEWQKEIKEWRKLEVQRLKEEEEKDPAALEAVQYRLPPHMLNASFEDAT